VSVGDYAARNRTTIGGGAVAVVLLAVVAAVFDLPVDQLLTVGMAERSLRAATPIALAAIGGLYAEKSGVFNIGLEGFMIFGAVNSVAIAFLVSGESVTQADLWIGLVGAVLLSVLYTVVFAVLLIRYKADQIIAGLAVWFLGLGFGPFTAVTIWGSQSSPRVGRINRVELPLLAELPGIGPLFDVSPLVLLTFVLVGVAWYVLYRTRWGYWVQAAGENPEALDTAGVDVNRVRYATVVFSGTMAGLGGAVLAIAISSGFVGSGLTNVNGRGWIAIVAYLFGNYNPVGAAAAALLFGGADMLQVQFQTVGIEVSSRLMRTLPFFTVLIVLTVYGRTRMPSQVGEPYESED